MSTAMPFPTWIGVMIVSLLVMCAWTYLFTHAPLKRVESAKGNVNLLRKAMWLVFVGIAALIGRIYVIMTIWNALVAGRSEWVNLGFLDAIALLVLIAMLDPGFGHRWVSGTFACSDSHKRGEEQS